MAVLFVSHASKDDTAAKGLEAWLRGHGFTDLFIDHSNIVGGDKWAQALRDAASACRVIICLVTEHWLSSDECFGEFRAASYMGKRIIPLLAVGPKAAPLRERLAKVMAEDQGFDVADCMTADGFLDLARDPQIERRLEEGLRAAGALTEIGLDPAAFAINRTLRPTPFPGLASFGDDDADAALFYGRSREIAEILDELRQVRALGDLRPLVILGASGAGKSSLLKAGVIPRLRREAPAWLPLRAFRPGADPLFNFAEALARTLAEFGKVEAAGAIRDRLFDVWSDAERDDKKILTANGRAALQATLEAYGSKLRAAADRAGASILISIDQAEELARAEGDSGDALSDCLRAALASTASRWHLTFTIRSDSFPELQGHRRFRDLNARAYDLRALPVFRFGSVVEEPAKRYGVTVDRVLADALMEDAPKDDALPLLAFALQRLWHQYADTKALTGDHYNKVGGLKGLIEDAAERALRGLGPEEGAVLPSGPPPKHQVDLAASTFVPALVQVNDQGATIRRIAPWNSFKDAQKYLLNRFDQWRLVVRKGDADGGTVEVAHEALFREWARLQGWLEPERARLEALRSLQVDALNWDRNGRDSAFLNHRDKRLAEALALNDIESYRERLSPLELMYLAACRTAEKSARSRARRIQTLIYLLLVGIIVGLVGWINQAAIKQQWHFYADVRPFMQSAFLPYVLASEAERALQPSNSFRECKSDQGKDYCPEMIVLKPGSFTMGSPADEHGRFANESPQHQVLIGEALAVSKFPVTFAEWDTCADHGDCDPGVSDSGYGRGPMPVINITWDDAEHYVAWLSRMTGRTYRLLSESEWEYAARAGTTTAYSFGNDPALLSQYGWYNADSGGKPHPVGQKKPNGWGLYDMEGDVWQWVQDCFHENYDGAPTQGSAWTTGKCSYRVLRGGSWYSAPDLLRSAYREWRSNDNRSDNRGFRVARTIGR